MRSMLRLFTYLFLLALLAGCGDGFRVVNTLPDGSTGINDPNDPGIGDGCPTTIRIPLRVNHITNNSYNFRLTEIVSDDYEYIEWLITYQDSSENFSNDRHNFMRDMDVEPIEVKAYLYKDSCLVYDARENRQESPPGNCGINKYLVNTSCVDVGNGYYSAVNSMERFECTNGPTNSVYSGPGHNGTNACPWICAPGYQESSGSCI